MREPYFKVGEEIILQSKEKPNLNGEYVIKKVTRGGDSYKCRLTGKMVFCPWGIEEFGYLLEEVMTADRDFENCWHPSALRKKYKPAEESFKELLNNIKQVKMS